MRRPYRELGKPFAVRTVELTQGLQLIADSIGKIKEGETRYLAVLSGQLRSLVAERSKGAVPLLLDMAEKFGKKLTIHCMPGADDPTLPEALRKDVILHVSGFPVTLERQFPGQLEMSLSAFLNERLILFRGANYSALNIIEWYANKAGGAHYSSSIPEDFAALMSLKLLDIQPLVNFIVQIGQATLDAGRALIKAMVDFEVYALVVIPEQNRDSLGEINYLFDSLYEGSTMRYSIWLDSRLMPSFFVSSLQGSWLRVDSDRMIDWSEPRLIHTSLSIEDDLSTTLELVVDGVRVGRSNIKMPLFVLSDPLDYDVYHNKSAGGQPQDFSFAVGQFAMFGRELGPEERANMLLYLSGKCKDPELKVIWYAAGAFGRANRGTKDLKLNGKATHKLARELHKSKVELAKVQEPSPGTTTKRR